VNEWPSGWFRDEKPKPAGGAGGAGGAAGASGAAGAGAPGAASPGAAGEPTVRLPAGGAGAPQAAGGAYARAAGQRGRAGAWPEQPPMYGPPPGGQRGAAPATRPRPPRPAPGRGGGRRGRHRVRRVLLFVGGLLLVLLVLAGGLYFYLDSKLARNNALVDFAGRPAAGAGQNWLITGSDSRQGLTHSQERKLHTGFVGGHRSDTILILHIPSNGGRPVLISLPRDSYVEVPGYGNNKINAAYSLGGPRLLARTVQLNTGLRIEHYIGIGFGGLVNVVNSVGGVNMCLPAPVHDQASGLNLKAGCQTLNGADALAWVRDRHNFANQDLQRVQNQRIFLRALLRKMTSPATLLNPFAAVPAAFGATSAVKVDQGTHLHQMLQVALALRNPETTTVPIANANFPTAVGDAVLWDNARANRLFHYLNHDQPVPRSLLTGSHLGS
jgi:LCP family protein required for cell wall assembly